MIVELDWHESGIGRRPNIEEICVWRLLHPLKNFLVSIVVVALQLHKADRSCYPKLGPGVAKKIWWLIERSAKWRMFLRSSFAKIRFSNTFRVLYLSKFYFLDLLKYNIRRSFLMFNYGIHFKFFSDWLNTILSNIERTGKIILWKSKKLERVYLLMIELEHLNFGFKRTDIEPIWPSLYLLNYLSNRLEHHFFEHRTDSNMFIFW